MSKYKLLLDKYKEFGIAEKIFHPIVIATGLPSAHPKEAVVFENNQIGQILGLNQNYLEIILFSQNPISPGTKIARTGKPLSITINKHLLGNIINPLGELLSSNKNNNSSRNKSINEIREVDIPPIGIKKRSTITKPLLTGVSLVDLTLPLGQGQRELVAGDRKTGKSSFLLSAIKNHIIQHKGIAIYAAIGKQSTEIQQQYQFFSKEKLIKNIIMVASTAHDSQGMIYTTPFTAMTIAEFFRDRGQNVLIVLDDLSTHAKFYREIALLAKRFPGRDSYPADIFFTHARLLERAGNFTIKKKQVSISCLAIAETVENDLTDYIVSNLIGITDGHLLFDINEFHKGRRPAIKPQFSVTRVGKQTQTELSQEINQKLIEFISQYEKTQELAHFGSDLSYEAKQILAKGDQLYSFFYQPSSTVIYPEIQLIMVTIIWLGFLTGSEKEIIRLRTNLTQALKRNNSLGKLIKQIIKKSTSFQELQDYTQQHRLQLIKTKTPTNPNPTITISPATQEKPINNSPPQNS